MMIWLLVGVVIAVLWLGIGFLIARAYDGHQRREHAFLKHTGIEAMEWGFIVLFWPLGLFYLPVWLIGKGFKRIADHQRDEV